MAERVSQQRVSFNIDTKIPIQKIYRQNMNVRESEDAAKIWLKSTNEPINKKTNLTIFENKEVIEQRRKELLIELDKMLIEYNIENTEDEIEFEITTDNEDITFEDLEEIIDYEDESEDE